MNVAEWILVSLLSIALLVFLILGIVLLSKLIELTKEAKKIIETGQDIAARTNNIVGNVQDITSIGGIVRTFTRNVERKMNKKGEKDGKQ